MKKNGLKILIIFALFLFSYADVKAACSWQEQKTYFDKSKGTHGETVTTTCSTGSILNKDASCSGTKPTYQQKDGVASKAICCCKTDVVSSNSDTKTEAKFKLPDYQFQIPIGDLSSLKTVDCSNGTCDVPFLADYIYAVYKYGLSVAGVIGVLMLMVAGLLWLVSGGDSGKITQAKKMIGGSIFGLTLLAGLTVFLGFINPDLAITKIISLPSISRIDIEFEGDNNSPTISMDISSISSLLGVNCGSDSVSQIVNKAKGRVTYSQEKRTKKTPEGYVYLDCSSFANFVLKCATGKNSAQNSAGVFNEQKIWDQKLESLQPGDMIGWAPKNSKKKSGHVIIYLGNGLFGDCHGGSGKNPGNCVSTAISFAKIKQYATSHSNGNLYWKRY